VLTSRLPKLVRYASVSAVATAASLTVLAVAVGLLGMTAGRANVLATLVGTIPSFELNRRWVWGKGGRRSMRAEIAPFVALSLSELAVSTVAVHLAGVWAEHWGWPTAARTTMVLAANVAAFGSLWVLQFVLLDRVVFRSWETSRPSAPLAAGPAANRDAPLAPVRVATRWRPPRTAAAERSSAPDEGRPGRLPRPPAEWRRGSMPVPWFRALRT
jgi:putative flippase GtrA